MKNSVCDIVRIRFCLELLFSFKSVTEIPVMYDKYDGYNGKQHGEINDAKPAPKASQMLMSGTPVHPNSFQLPVRIPRLSTRSKSRTAISKSTMVPPGAKFHIPAISNPMTTASSPTITTVITL